MPTKNMDLMDVILYAIDPELGVPVKVGVVSEMCFDDILDTMESVNDAIVKLGTSAEITCNAVMDLCTWWNLFCGYKLTNNYLKMHGGVMSRRKPSEKGRKCLKK